MNFFGTLEEIIRTTSSSFDFGFVISVNVIAYLAISAIDANNGKAPVKTWTKRLITVICGTVLGMIYFSLQLGDVKIILNSMILSFVSWSWIIKPILIKFGIDYRKFDDDYTKDKDKDNE